MAKEQTSYLVPFTSSVAVELKAVMTDEPGDLQEGESDEPETDPPHMKLARAIRAGAVEDASPERRVLGSSRRRLRDMLT